MFIPTVGIVYKFSFVPGFTALDGVYHVGQLLTFQETLNDGISIPGSFFIKAGKTQTDYEADLTNIRDTKILKLLNPDSLSEESVIYAPFNYLATMPDHNIKKYYTLAVGLNLGIHDDPEQLTYITNALSEEFKTTIGIESSPELFEINNTWLTPDEYGAIVDVRKQNTLKVLNYFSEMKRLQLVNDSLRSRLAAYEEIIKTHIPANGG